MFEKVEKIEKKYQELGIILSKPEVIQDYEKFRDLSKQRKTMEETVNIYYQYKAAVEAINEAKEMLHGEKDTTMREFLNNEISSNEQKISEYEHRLKVLLSRHLWLLLRLHLNYHKLCRLHSQPAHLLKACYYQKSQLYQLIH